MSSTFPGCSSRTIAASWIFIQLVLLDIDSIDIIHRIELVEFHELLHLVKEVIGSLFEAPFDLF